MSNITLITPEVSIHDNHVSTTSKNIADYFGKQHKNVLQSINNLKTDIPQEWYELNFQPIQIDVDLGAGRTRQDSAFEITRDGFTLLAMGFTGKQALQWKIAYIEAFNAMEAHLNQVTQQLTLTSDEVTNLPNLIQQVRFMREAWKDVSPSLRLMRSPFAKQHQDCFSNAGSLVLFLKRIETVCLQQRQIKRQ